MRMKHSLPMPKLRANFMSLRLAGCPQLLGALSGAIAPMVGVPYGHCACVSGGTLITRGVRSGGNEFS